MTNEEYHSNEALSQTKLKKFADSPRIFYIEEILKIKSNDSTVSKNLGTCLDLALTEPDRYNQLIVRDSKTTMLDGFITAHWKKLIDQWIANLNDYDIELFGRKVKFYDIAKKCQKQKIMFWNDPKTGELCRGKPDFYHSQFMIDLKSTCATTLEEFIKQIYKYKYYIQAGFYNIGHNELNHYGYVPFIFIAVSTVTGEVFAVEMSKEFLNYSFDEINTILARYKHYQDNNLWLKNKEQITLDPPQWLKDKITLDMGVLE